MLPTHSRQRSLVPLWATLISLAAACQAADEPPGDDDVADEIVDNLLRAGFPRHEIELRADGLVFVGGDAEVSLTASREMVGIDGDGPAFRHYGTTNQVGIDVETICVDGSATAGTLSAGINLAIAAYNAEGLRFQFLRADSPQTGCDANIAVEIVPDDGSTTVASAGFPAGGLPHHTVSVWDDTLANGATWHAAVMMHELGHCIGLRHTDFFDRSLSCGSGGDETALIQGAVHIPGTPTGFGSGNSIMNACVGTATAAFNPEDQAALGELYGDLRALGRDCQWNEQCESGACDNHTFSTDTLTCIPSDGAGQACDYCTHDSHCLPGIACVEGSCESVVETNVCGSNWISNFGDAQGWAPLQYSSTIDYPDVDGDGRADLCGRGGSGIYCARSSGLAFTNLTLFSDAFSDANGWDGGPEYFSTIDYPDADGDGRGDVCGRGAGGIWCAKSDGLQFGAPALWTSQFRDNHGWNSGPEYYGTIRFPDIDGDGRDDVCGRGAGGIHCATSLGDQYSPLSLWTSKFRDAHGWANGPQFYSTIRFPDVDGDGRADVCGRGGAGVSCAKSNGSTFGAVSLWSAAYSNGNGWAAGPEHYATLQYADIDGDGRDDLCGRGGSGIRCAVSTGDGFSASSLWSTQFRDIDGGDQPQYYETIQLRDFDGDGMADLCGRGVSGMYCSLSTGGSFGTPT
ncbi:MAG: M57 family metalloprotease, partial [Myxococcota bacterium]